MPPDLPPGMYYFFCYFLDDLEKYFIYPDIVLFGLDQTGVQKLVTSGIPCTSIPNLFLYKLNSQIGVIYIISGDVVFLVRILPITIALRKAGGFEPLLDI